MPDGVIEPKRGRKFDQVLAGARQVFLDDGFEGASVDEIARAAGVSKATLYSYFPDKRMLFMEVARTECARQAENAMDTIDMDADVAQVLHRIGHEIVAFITSRFGKRIFRTCVGESDRFPELGREFYDSGPKLVRDKIVGFFQIAIGRGELQIDDLTLAADQFHELCKADIFPRVVFNMTEEFTDAERKRVVDGAVAMFLARYGT
ncbi:TetR/AcrR family transcriptional regulator [Yoonia sediminilitoris]|uniref:TetR family transcriptional regulator n=1 Tax=Yoonia sediminilitoris TaxID=1286148 RepID=A0A2T6KIC7_9RHOB|nr:TetR/AcrR family transcriptional regulator [Yoonia sediminilitoris]PUB15479.1 TetR family transcriptional regulator [Yoonia sediminilitoris]RCW96089.1 TetR family transcriptional regulator [Yoonia sediminilitoris]